MAEVRRRHGGLAHSAIVEWAVRFLTVLSSVALAVMLTTIFVGVVLRYVFGNPLLGVNEVVQLTSVALVMLAMPAAAHDEMHIKVDVLDNAIGRVGRLVGDVLSRVLAIGVLVLLIRRSWLKLLDAAEYGDATNMLSIPIWPFYGLIVLGTTLYVAVLALQLIDRLAARAERNG